MKGRSVRGRRDSRKGTRSSRRRRVDSSRREAPFVELQGKLYLNLGFDLEPFDNDGRVAAAAHLWLGVDTRRFLALRELGPKEAAIVRRCRSDADVEAWARVMAPRRRVIDDDR